MDKIQKGLLYLVQAQKALTRDFEAAFVDRDWNIAVRRAQESAEYAVKCLYLIVDEEPNREHDANVSRALVGKIPAIWFPPGGLPARVHGGIYVSWAEEHGYRVEVWWAEAGTYTLLAASGPLGGRTALQLSIEEGQIEILVDGKVSAIGWAPDGGVDRLLPEGRWMQTPIDDATRRLINRHTAELAKLRNDAFYFDRLLGEQDANRARDRAHRVVVTVLRSLGLESAADSGDEDKIIKGSILAAPDLAVRQVVPTFEVMLEALEKIKSA